MWVESGKQEEEVMAAKTREAAREAAGIGKADSGNKTKRILAVGKDGKDDKQRKLELSNEVKKDKKVTFSTDKEKREQSYEKDFEEYLDYISREINEMRNEKKKGIEMLEELKKKEKNWEIRIRMIEEKMEELENEFKEMREKVDNEINKKEGDEMSVVSKNSSRYSRWENSVGSGVMSEGSDRLSVREVSKIKKIIVDREKEEKKNNIVIKGIKKEATENSNLKEWVEKLLKNKLGKEYNLEYCRWSGSVILAKVKNIEEKIEIMKQKNKLKGEVIYIENDLTWEERRTQEKISKWAKEKRSRGIDVKVGFRKIRLNGNWKYWNEMESIIERDLEEKERKERVEGVNSVEDKREENFG